MNEPLPAPSEGAGNAAPPSLWDLARTFNLISLSSFGGGLSAWSHEIVVRRRGWLSETEFLSALTLCRLLPGANQVNVAIFVGTRLRGFSGALAAVAGLIAVPFWIIILLIASAQQLDSPTLRHVMGGLTAAAIALTLSMVWQTGRKALRSAVPFGLAALTTVMSGVLRAPLWLTLLVVAPLGILWAWRQANPEGANPEGTKPEATSPEVTRHE
jgi:chromate transporter